MEWINEPEYFFINWWEFDAYWSAFAYDFKKQKLT